MRLLPLCSASHHCVTQVAAFFAAKKPGVARLFYVTYLQVEREAQLRDAGVRR